MKKIMIVVATVFAIVIIGMGLGTEKAYAQSNIDGVWYTHEEVDHMVDEFVEKMEVWYETESDRDIDVYNHYWEFTYDNSGRQEIYISIVAGSEGSVPMTDTAYVYVDELVICNNLLDTYFCVTRVVG